MNKTNFEHGFIAVIIQIPLAFLIGWWAAGAVAVAVFVGREYGQVEYKVRARTGRSLTDMMPWHVLNAKYWSLDAVLDMVVPVVMCSSVAFIAGVL